MNFFSPPYSFVVFNWPYNINYTLPFINNDDLKFQVNLQIPDVAAADSFWALHEDRLKLHIFRNSDWTNIDALDEAKATAIDLSLLNLRFTVIRISEVEFLLRWEQPLGFINLQLPMYSCFRLAIRYMDAAGNVAYSVSNAFKMLPNTEKYTTAFEYWCEEDVYGFQYCNGAKNKVRLPIYFKNMQLPTDKKVYRRSNGTIKVLKAVTRKSFDGVVAALPEKLHEKVKVMLDHDSINAITRDWYAGIVNEDAYTIQYPDVPGLNQDGNASFKIFQTPFLLRNTNCATCVVCDGVQIEPGHTLPDGQAGEPYSYSIPITGNMPIVFGSLVKPSWMSVDIIDSEVVFSGTPDTAIEDLEVSFTVSNCGFVTAPFSDSITVTSEACLPVVVEDATLPNATVGMPYAKDITLTGSAPFVITASIKPSWMSINIVGAKVELRGTPPEGADGTGIAVEFTITNCESASTDTFSNTMVVEAAGESNPGAPGVKLYVGYGASAAIACSNFPTQEVYVANTGSNIVAGIYVYVDEALTTVLAGANYITDAYGHIYFIASGGYVTGMTSTTC